MYMLPVTFGIPQGSVLGPTLFVLFTNDLLSSIDNVEIYMYADDTTVFAVGVSAEVAIAKLNTALKKLYKWCLCNKLTFHPKKSEFMLLGKSSFRLTCKSAATSCPVYFLLPQLTAPGSPRMLWGVSKLGVGWVMTVQIFLI